MHTHADNMYSYIHTYFSSKIFLDRFILGTSMSSRLYPQSPCSYTQISVIPGDHYQASDLNDLRKAGNFTKLNLCYVAQGNKSYVFKM